MTEAAQECEWDGSESRLGQKQDHSEILATGPLSKDSEFRKPMWRGERMLKVRLQWPIGKLIA